MGIDKSALEALYGKPTHYVYLYGCDGDGNGPKIPKFVKDTIDGRGYLLFGPTIRENDKNAEVYGICSAAGLKRVGEICFTFNPNNTLKIPDIRILLTQIDDTLISVLNEIFSEYVKTYGGDLSAYYYFIA